MVMVTGLLNMGMGMCKGLGMSMGMGMGAGVGMRMGVGMGMGMHHTVVFSPAWLSCWVVSPSPSGWLARFSPFRC